jgi:hypothetical protein
MELFVLSCNFTGTHAYKKKPQVVPYREVDGGQGVK